MKASRLEEIFEECLSAYLEGRRSIEESLSLYPSLAKEVEPLLRTAAEVGQRAPYGDPPQWLQEQVRWRFLAAAAERRRARMAAERAVAWRRGIWRWSPVALAASAAAVALILVVVASPGNGGGGQSGVQVEVVAPSPTLTPLAPPPVAVGNLAPQIEKTRGNVEALSQIAAQGGPIDRGVIEEVKATTAEIASQVEVSSPLGSEEEEELVDVLSEQYSVLGSLVGDEGSGEDVDEVKDVLGLTEEVLKKLGVSLPASPTPVATPTPASPPTGTPTPTSTPEPTPTPTSEAVPTAILTPTATPTPEASATPAP